MWICIWNIWTKHNFLKLTAMKTLTVPILVKASFLSIPETATTPNIIEMRITNVGCRFAKVTSKSKLRRGKDEIQTWLITAGVLLLGTTATIARSTSISFWITIFEFEIFKKLVFGGYNRFIVIKINWSLCIYVDRFWYFVGFENLVYV